MDTEREKERERLKRRDERERKRKESLNKRNCKNCFWVKENKSFENRIQHFITMGYRKKINSTDEQLKH